jgi:hypothetical protein
MSCIFEVRDLVELVWGLKAGFDELAAVVLSSRSLLSQRMTNLQVDMPADVRASAYITSQASVPLGTVPNGSLQLDLTALPVPQSLGTAIEM